MEIRTPLAVLERPLSAVILDVDGVVLDTMRPQYEWLRSVADHYCRPWRFGTYGQEFLETYMGWLERKGMPGIYEMLGLDFNTHGEEIWKLYDAFNRAHPIGIVEVEGVSVGVAIKELATRGSCSRVRSTRLRLAANTTKGYDNLESILGKNGLWSCFDTIVTYDDLFRILGDGVAKRSGENDPKAFRKLVPGNVMKYAEKPNSLSAALTISRLGTGVRSLLAVEDTPAGIRTYKPVQLPEGPKRAYVVGVTWGFEPDPEKLFAAGADAVIDRPEELVEIVKETGGFS